VVMMVMPRLGDRAIPVPVGCARGHQRVVMSIRHELATYWLLEVEVAAEACKDAQKDKDNRSDYPDLA
jgi:hypothetical protein